MLLKSMLGVFRIEHECVETKARKQGVRKRMLRGRSYVVPEMSLSCTPELVQQSKWADLPPELLLDIIQRVEAGCTSWPARRSVVACAAICNSWRKIVKEVIKTPEQCGLLTFPCSLKQPGPRDAPFQCFIKRDRATSIYRLYLGLSPALSGDACKLLLAAKKVKRTTRTDFLISLGPDDYSSTSDKYMGRMRSNLFGNKLCIYDSQPPCRSASKSTGWFNKYSDKLKRKSKVATITYELSIMRSRGPRKMLSTMHTIPVAAIQQGGTALTPATFSEGPQNKLCSPASREKTRAETFGLAQSPTGNENYSNPLVLKNKAPRWHEQLQCWCLNFNGRVTVASVKNFQLVASVDPLQDVPNAEIDRVILQFGKIGKDVFTMDFCYPLCVFKAFAICLSSFDTKPACE